MSDFEKLVELIDDVSEGHAENLLQPFGAETLASRLIDNGVTVKQMQKPIAFEELYDKFYSVVWCEDGNSGILNELLSPLRLMYVGHAYAEFEQFGSKDWIALKVDDYGYTWRCWASEPTSKEMGAAEWE